MLAPLAATEARRLRDLFAEVDYTETGVGRVFGGSEIPLPTRLNLPPMLDRTREPSPLHLLMRWFLLGVPVQCHFAEKRLPSWFVSLCCDCRLLQHRNESLISALAIVPFESLWIASDAFRRLRSRERFDHVLTVNPTARHLLNFTIRNPVAATLDLCTGCGVQALVAARHSDRVMATDLNDRAIEFTQFNAALNGIENIESIAGDGFAPVEDRTFDRIVCNPPFVLAPSSEYLYRDNPLQYDAFCRQLVQSASKHLNLGGFFQMIFEWVQVEGQPWQDRIAQWCDSSGCDVWVLKANTQRPENYAQSRIREIQQETTEPQGGNRTSSEDDREMSARSQKAGVQASPEFARGDPFLVVGGTEVAAADYDQWVDYYRRGRVVGIHGGLIAMRRRDGDNWLRFDELSENITNAYGDEVLGVFDAHSFLQGHQRDEALLQVHLRLTGDLRLEQQYELVDGDWQTVSLRIRRICGIPRILGLDTGLAKVLPLFDGSRSVSEILQQLADELAVPPDRIQPDLLNVTRTLVERGFLR